MRHILFAAATIALGPPACGPDRSQFLDSGADTAPFDDHAAAADTIDVRDVAVVDVVDRTVPVDAARDASDASGVFDAASDGPADASPSDGATDVPPADAGPSARCTPVIDGTIGADWTTEAAAASNAVASMWGTGLNELHALRVCYDASNLYLGITGTVEASNGMVLYLDRDFGASSGVSLFNTLGDHSGTLDSRVSAALLFGSGAAGFAAEGAWGTTDMNAALGGDAGVSDLAGLRLFAPSVTRPGRRTDFDWIAGVTTICRHAPTAAACEVAIPWPLLFEGPPPAATTVAMFARLNNGDASMTSNQTLPQDDPSTPRTVNRLLVVGVHF